MLLTDYLSEERLAGLEDAFSGVSQAPIRLVDSGSPIDERQDVRAPIEVDRRHVGWVLAAMPDEEVPPKPFRDRLERFVHLTAEIVGRFCKREDILHARVEELVTVYRLMAEFTGPRSLQEILAEVPGAVVEAMNVKACAIRLLNEDHSKLVIKAVAGLSEEYLDKGQILLSESRIDQEVLATGKPVAIEDMTTDPRVVYQEEIRREGIVSGLCAPLMYRGHPEGVIRVYTDRRHEFRWFEESLLTAIAAGAASAIVNARLYEEAESASRMRRQLHMAGQVQRQMLPENPPHIPGFEFGTVYVPTYELSGDFYDFIELPEDNLGIAICDVCGKGVRASLLMATVRASLRGHAVNVYEMSEVLNKVNRDLCAGTASGDFATMFYAVLDVGRRRLTYSNAGHMPPILFRDSQARSLHVRSTVIGVDPFQRYAWDSLEIQPGDVLLTYTDGLSEALNFEDEEFGRERILSSSRVAIDDGRDAQGIANHILWEMRRFAGLQTRFDDCTIVVVRAT